MNERPDFAPAEVRLRGVTYSFEQVAPITGDAIYVGARKNERVHALVTNPNALQAQRRRFGL